MTRTADVVVVGGGLVGLSLAYELGCAGVDVVLVDDRQPGRATDAGAGILSPATTWNPDPVWFAFGQAAGAHYGTLIERLADDGAPATGYDRCGLLLLAMVPGEDDWFATRAELALDRSPGLVSEITPDQARTLFPPLGPVRRALHNPDAARVDGRLMAAAVLHGARRHGVSVLEATVRSLLLDGGRAVGVDTTDGTVACGTVAIAGGAWSPTFGAALGVTIPVKPVKGQIVHLQLPGSGGAAGHRDGDSGRWPIASPVLQHYLVAWPGGRVACGGTYEPDAGFDAAPTVAGLSELLTACLSIAPGLAPASVVDVRVGLRPVAADDLPVLGPLPGWDNVHVVTGHGTEGLLLGPYSAAVVAGRLTGSAFGTGNGTAAGAVTGAGADGLAAFSVARFGA